MAVYLRRFANQLKRNKLSEGVVKMGLSADRTEEESRLGRPGRRPSSIRDRRRVAERALSLWMEKVASFVGIGVERREIAGPAGRICCIRSFGSPPNREIRVDGEFESYLEGSRPKRTRTPRAVTPISVPRNGSTG